MLSFALLATRQRRYRDRSRSLSSPIPAESRYPILATSPFPAPTGVVMLDKKYHDGLWAVKLCLVFHDCLSSFAPTADRSNFRTPHLCHKHLHTLASVLGIIFGLASDSNRLAAKLVCTATYTWMTNEPTKSEVWLRHGRFSKYQSRVSLKHVRFSSNDPSLAGPSRRSKQAMPDNHEASETSPLLRRTSDNAPPRSLPNGTGINGSITDGAKVGNEEQAKDVVTEYQGMPEVRARLKYILPAVAIGIFLSAADQTLIVTMYGKIGSDLKALSKTSWVSTAYFLTLSSSQPLYGKLSDIFGRKPALLFAYAIFGIGCLFCGLARDMNELIAARAFAGLGGGGMTTVVSILMSDIVPLRERGTWQGVINIIYATGAGCGAPLGGILADLFNWRWAFLAQAPMCALAIVSVMLTLHLPKKQSESWKKKLARVDFPGAFVLVSAVFALLLGLDRGSNVSWSIPIAYVPLALSVPLFTLFGLVEQRFAAEPFAPSRIIWDRGLVACYFCNFFSFAGYLAVLFYLPLFFQAVDGYTATQASIRLLPAIIAGVSGSLFGGILMQRTGKYYWLTVVAYTLLLTGVLIVTLCANVLVNNTYGIAVGLVLSGFGNGIGVTSSLIGLIANAAQEDQAVATACSYLFRSLGSIVGLSLVSTVVQQSLRNQLQDCLHNAEDAEDLVQRVRQSLGFIKTLSPEVKQLVQQCYSHATRNGFILMVGIVSFSMLSAFFVREKRLGK